MQTERYFQIKIKSKDFARGEIVAVDITDIKGNIAKVEGSYSFKDFKIGVDLLEVTKQQYLAYDNGLSMSQFDVLDNYFDPRRHYHNKHHVLTMQRLLEQAVYRGDVELSVRDRKILHTAIEWHDVIFDYQNAPTMNERWSADAYVPSGTLMFDNAATCEIEDMINDTAHHFDGKSLSSKLSDILLDLDIHNFFVPTYQRYQDETEKLNREILAFGVKPDDMIAGRIKFLNTIKEGLVPRSRVLDQFGTNRELLIRAHANITMSLNELQG